MELLCRHPIVDACATLLPGIVVRGGSFAAQLPAVHGYKHATALATLQRGRAMARDSCLHALLHAVDYPPSDIPHDTSGALQWPIGIVGSIAHKGTVVIGAIGYTRHVPAIGIDIDVLHACDDLRESLVLEETDIFVNTAEACGATLCAKEAFYKAQFPLTRKSLDYRDVRLIWDPTAWGAFVAQHRDPGFLPTHRFYGRVTRTSPGWVGAVVRSDIL